MQRLHLGLDLIMIWGVFNEPFLKKSPPHIQIQNFSFCFAGTHKKGWKENNYIQIKPEFEMRLSAVIRGALAELGQNFDSAINQLHGTYWTRSCASIFLSSQLKVGLEPSLSNRTSAVMEMPYICAVQYGSHYLHVAIEHLKGR